MQKASQHGKQCHYFWRGTDNADSVSGTVCCGNRRTGGALPFNNRSLYGYAAGIGWNDPKIYAADAGKRNLWTYRYSFSKTAQNIDCCSRQYGTGKIDRLSDCAGAGALHCKQSKSGTGTFWRNSERGSILPHNTIAPGASQREIARDQRETGTSCALQGDRYFTCGGGTGCTHTGGGQMQPGGDALPRGEQGISVRFERRCIGIFCTEHQRVKADPALLRRSDSAGGDRILF